MMWHLRLRSGEVEYRVFFFQAEDGIRDSSVTGVQTCALPISMRERGSTSERVAPGDHAPGQPAFWRSRPARSLTSAGALGNWRASWSKALQASRFRPLPVSDIASFSKFCGAFPLVGSF